MMTLYSGNTCPYSQRCRIVLFEKGMDFEIIDVDLHNKPEDLALMNPYNRVPVLVERDLILYEANIINEYIDERFPHPQLMPADPVMRARARLFLFNFEQDLFSHVHAIEHGSQKAAEKARGLVRDSLTQIAPIFAKQKYMLLHPCYGVWIITISSCRARQPTCSNMPSVFSADRPLSRH
jgi:RNA polymerase-associated protein